MEHAALRGPEDGLRLRRQQPQQLVGHRFAGMQDVAVGDHHHGAHERIGGDVVQRRRQVAAAVALDPPTREVLRRQSCGEIEPEKQAEAVRRSPPTTGKTAKVKPAEAPAADTEVSA